MKKYKAIKISLLIVIGIIVIYFLSPYYVQKALVYQKVGIDDYPIFENRVVEKGESMPWAESDVYNMGSYSDSLRSKIEELSTIAFLVIRDKQILYEEYWDGYSAASKTNSFSAAKSIIGLLTGIAIDEGKIKSIDDKVTDYFPEIGGEYSNILTIKDVLAMSSGLNWDESYGSLFSTTTEAYYGNNLDKLIFRLNVVDEPGQEFKYLSGNTQLLAMIVKKATGMNVSDYASEKLWKPLGAEYDALWSLDKEDGMEKSYCCFNSNARDFARIGQLVLDTGKWIGNQLVSSEYILMSENPVDGIKEPGTDIDIDYYGLQWWLMNYKNHKIIYARGILGQYIFAIPDMNTVVVRLGHKRSENKISHHPECAYTYIQAAFEIIDQEISQYL